MMKLSLVFLLLISLLGCKSKMTEYPIESQPASAAVANSGNSRLYTYLALGDSYTIGEAVPATLSFPFQLAAALSAHNYKVNAPTIIARTGWTTSNLIRAIADSAFTRKFDFVTLLIGVNNQYQGQSQDTYRTEFVQLLNTAINFASGNKKHVFVVSIPDYSVTPFALGLNKTKIAAEIDQFNAINLAESQKAGVNYVDITPISRQAATNTSLIALDGLHPSGQMYGLWVQQIYPGVVTSL